MYVKKSKALRNIFSVSTPAKARMLLPQGVSVRTSLALTAPNSSVTVTAYSTATHSAD